jgi:hypothetical protein
MRTTPLRRTTLHFMQIFFTDALTFIHSPYRFLPSINRWFTRNASANSEASFKTELILLDKLFCRGTNHKGTTQRLLYLLEEF